MKIGRHAVSDAIHRETYSFPDGPGWEIPSKTSYLLNLFDFFFFYEFVLVYSIS